MTGWPGLYGAMVPRPRTGAFVGTVTSASRSLADLRAVESRAKAFDVRLPLGSGHWRRGRLKSAFDPEWTLARLSIHRKLTTIRPSRPVRRTDLVF